MSADTTVVVSFNPSTPVDIMTTPLANSHPGPMVPIDGTGGAAGGAVIYSKRGVYAPGATRTSLITWTGETLILDGSDQSQVPPGDLVDIGIYAVTQT